MIKPMIKLLWVALFFTANAQATDLYTPGEGSDPRLRNAFYLAGDQRHFSALTELLQMNPGGDFTKMPPDYQWLLAQAYVDFGMRSKAEAIYRNLAITTIDHGLLARSRLRLAELQYQRGYYDEARKTLYGMREKMPDDVVLYWQDLLARVLMADGRYGEAVEVLTDLKNGDQQSPFTRFNLGVALINDGQVQKGRDVIDRIGKQRPTDLETLALRDRANLTLAWNFLTANQGGTAKPIFYRIRSQGPYSNRALLGLGWAELAPKGERQSREIPEDLTPFSTFATLGGLLRAGFLDRENVKRANARYKLDNIAPDEQDALQRAMVAWVELISRDPMDPAVQEAWLAIPYSLDRLGAHTQALQFYEQAVAQLEQNRQRIDLALVSIRKGVMVETIVRRDIDAESGWEWKLKDLPDTPETYYLQSLLAEHRFQEALKNYRDVRLMARDLDAWKTRLTTLELQYVARGENEEPPQTLFKRAKEGWVEPWKGINIELRAETGLSAPGAFDAPFAAPALPQLKLTLGATPKRFNGPYERIQDLKARIGNLRELLATAGAEQSRLLQDMASKELAGQKKAIEKYLVEARFALARLYDRVLKETGGEPPAAEKAAGREGLITRLLNILGAGGDDSASAETAPKPKKDGEVK